MPVQKFEDVAPSVGTSTKELFAAINLTEAAAPGNTCKDIVSHPLDVQTLSAEFTSNTVESLTDFIKTHCTLREDAGATAAQMRDSLDNIASRSYLSSRIVQSRASDIFKKANDVVARDEILVYPLPAFGALDTMDPQSLKLVPVFRGDEKESEKNSELFKDFVRTLFDQVRGKCTKIAARDCLLKKLAGCAQSIVAVSYTHLTLPTKA